MLAAAGIKCLGGDMQCAMWPRDEKERKSLIAEGHEADLGRVFFADDLANGKNIIFCATGISDSALLRGVKSQGATATTYSILMRAKSRTVRFIRASHDLQNKTIRLRSDLALGIEGNSVRAHHVLGPGDRVARSRRSAVLLKPFRPRTSHIVKLRSVTVKRDANRFS